MKRAAKQRAGFEKKGEHAGQADQAHCGDSLAERPPGDQYEQAVDPGLDWKARWVQHASLNRVDEYFRAIARLRIMRQKRQRHRDEEKNQSEMQATHP
jgi:hypothetical protein